MPPVAHRRPSSPDKLRGGYYTPPPLAAWLCRWAVRSSADRVLEPSAGDGTFLTAAAAALLAHGAAATAVVRQLTGVEIDPAEARKAGRALAFVLGGGRPADVHAGDFFAWLTAHPEA